MMRRPRQHWKIDAHATAWKQFNALTYPQKQGVFAALLPVLEANDPAHASGVRDLQGKLAGYYRVRARDHRVIFEIRRTPTGRFRGIIYIIAILDRKDAY